MIGADTGALGKWGVAPGDLLIGFEDLPRRGVDSDFNDIVFRLDVGPAFVESLEKVSTSPQVSIGLPEGSAPLVAATVVFDARAGAQVRMAGTTLDMGDGHLAFEGLEIDVNLGTGQGADGARRA